MSPTDDSEKSLGEIVAEVSEKASLLVREEIELAKAEVLTKARTLGKGAAVAAAAGVFLVFALVMLLHTLSWFWVDLFDFSQPWMGFGITTVLLIGLGVLAGLKAKQWLSTGPPTPNIALEEARITRQTLEHQGIARDQLGRSREREGQETKT
ncbi:MAG: phage holin family protein [Actinomycetota bacterium]|nr:phage holin family protein [Actinomycetota bacterium]